MFFKCLVFVVEVGVGVRYVERGIFGRILVRIYEERSRGYSWGV